MCSGVLLSPSVHGPFSFARRFSVCISHCSNEKPLKDHDSSWVPSNSWQRGGGDSSARPRRPKLRRFGPHRLSGRSPPPQPAAARGRRPPKRHNTSFKAQWARRSRSSIVGSAAQLTPNPSRTTERRSLPARRALAARRSCHRRRRRRRVPHLPSLYLAATLPRSYSSTPAPTAGKGLFRWPRRCKVTTRHRPGPPSRCPGGGKLTVPSELGAPPDGNQFLGISLFDP